MFNVACNERHSLLDIVAHDRDACSAASCQRNHVAPRRGDVRHTQASIEHIQRRLRLPSHVGFEEGMRRTFEWFKLQ